MATGDFTTAPSLEEMSDLATAGLARIPERFRRHLGEILITVEEHADRPTLAGLGRASRWSILGLYRGRSVLARSFLDPGRLPDRIFLYRKPILLAWIVRKVDLAALVQHVLVHEIAHHLGFSEAGIEAAEREADREPR